ncbi:immunoglobulin-like domain-containing protein, partial [Legionella septentrionalis]|uniref:immunoglobulin-like domain-containing protein n=1 Tax=Legionella septentrionalis TaxID=2498109 RepID=UPI000F8E1F54
TSGSVTFPAPTDDAYIDAGSQTISISNAIGGNYEQLDTSDTATITVQDTIDTTTVTLGDVTVNEGGTITLTANVNNAPQTDLTLTLSNGEVITILAGQTSGSVTFPAPTDDAYVDADSQTISISNATGGNYEQLDTSDTATITVQDTIDTTTVTLGDVTVNEGGTITLTANVNNAPQTDLTLTLSNGQVITILAGQTSGSVTFPAPTDDAYIDADSQTISISNAAGGNYEQLDTSDTATITVQDTINTTTVTLGDVTVNEGGSITLTANVNNAPQTDLTLTLSNGEVITILAGQTSGSVTFPAPTDDAYIDAGTQTISISNAAGGNYEQLDTSDTATITVQDTIDTTTVTLGDVTVNEGGTITLTANVNNAPQTDLTLTLSNGQVITILAGQTSGSVTFPAPTDDAYIDAGSQTISISNAIGGNYEQLDTSDTATITVQDTIDTTTVTLSDVTVNEGGTITLTANVNNAPQTDLTLTLSNGQVITILAGQTSGSVTFPAPTDDAYIDADSQTISISSAAGGNYEQLDTSDTATITVQDTIDTTTVTLGDVTVNEGGTITLTANVNNAPQTDLTLTLSNGQVITILAGQTSGSVTFPAPTDDAYVDADSQTISISNAAGGNYEQLDISDTATITVQDTIDTTTVTLGDVTVNEGGTITLTANVNNAPQTDLTLTLSNGQVITILAGQTSGSVTFPAPTDDAYVDADSQTISISNAAGGNYEQLDISDTATITVQDTINTTTVTLGDVTVNEGGMVTLTANVNNAPQTDLTLTLSNGQVITILAGQTSGSITFAAPTDDAYLDAGTQTISISNATGGNYESLNTSDTATITVQDTINTTTVTLGDVTVNEGGMVTLIANVNNAPQTDLTLTLSNGQVITILAGQTSGSVTFAAPADDPYIDASTQTISISNAIGGNYESLNTSDTATITVQDTINTTTVTLGDVTVNEGGMVTLTANVNNAPQTDLTLTLSNGQVITILAGQTSGSITFPAPTDDAYVDAGTQTISISNATGGNYESLNTNDTATITVQDTIDTTTVTLGDVIVNEGGMVTLTANVNNAPQTNLTLTLSNGQVITIPAGQTSGSVTFPAPADDAYVDAGTQTISINNATGGNYESLNTSDTAIVTILDTINTTTLNLSGPSVVSEGGSGIYTLTVTNPPATALTVTIVVNHVTTNSADLTATTFNVIIPAHQSSVTFNVNTFSDQLAESNESFTVAIQGTSGGNYENLVVGTGIVTTTIPNDDFAPVAQPDSGSVIEGSILSGTSVLTNDTDANFDALNVSQFAANGSGTGAVSANGTNTITTALGGTVKMNANGTYTYTAPATVNNPGGANVVDSFYYKASDGTNTSSWTQVSINVQDTAPLANPDVNSVAFQGAVSGNVITANDVLGQDATQLHSVTYNNTTYTNFVNGTLTINTANGVLAINQNGSYTYTSTASLPTTSTSYGGGNSSSLWSGVGVYGYSAGTNPLTSSPNATVSIRNNYGLYISGGGDADEIDSRIVSGNVRTETVAIDLLTPASSLQVEAREVDSGDNVGWAVYNLDGSNNLVLVGSGVTNATGSGSNGSLTFNITANVPFRYVAFYGVDGNDDFNIWKITANRTDYNYDVPNDVFTYVIRDADGSQSSSTLTIDHGTPNPVATADIASVSEAGLSGGTQAGVVSVVAEGNLLTNDANTGDASISSVTFNGVTATPVGGVITIDTPLGLLKVYTQNGGGHSKGDYEYTLQTSSTQGDNVNESFTYRLSHNVTGMTSDGNLTINIADDAPIGQNVSASFVGQSENIGVNLILVLDVSTSMATIESNGMTRLAMAKQALQELIQAGEDLGNVNVKIITFSTKATNSGWFVNDVDGALNYLNNISSDGYTYYDAALQEVIRTHNIAPVPIAANNLLYFLSDGEPTSGHGVNDGSLSYGSYQDVAAWEKFIDDTNIDKAYGVGFGEATLGPLEMVAYPTPAGQGGAFILQTISDLANGFIDQYGNNISSSVISGGSVVEGFVLGADGGYIKSIVVDGITHTYNPSTSPAGSEVLVIETDLGGVLTFNFLTGQYSYNINTNHSIDGQEVIPVTVIDADGDQITKNLTLDIDYTAAGIDANRDTVITNIAQGNVISFDASALLKNDMAINGTTVSAVTNGTGSTVTLNNGIINLTPTALTFSGANFSTNSTTTLINEGSSNNTSATADVINRSAFSSGFTNAGLNHSGYSTGYRGSISSSDQDWFRISLAAGELLWIDVDPRSSIISNVDVFVYDKAASGNSAGNMITQVFDYTLSNQGTEGAFVAQYSGDYYFQINSTTSANYDVFLTIDNSQADYRNFNYTITHQNPNSTVSDSSIVDVVTQTGNTLTGTEKSEVLVGGNTNDIINANGGDDSLFGGLGNDTLNGGSGKDMLVGGRGNDTMTGGTGKDTFVWKAGDDTGNAIDTITDFTPGQNGDVLDLSNLLTGEHQNAQSLDSYLQVSYNNTTQNTTIAVDADGGATFSATQTIILAGVDLTAGGTLQNTQILTELINNGNIVTDA